MTAIFGDKVATDLLPLLDQTRAKLSQTFRETPLMDNQSLKDLDAMMDKLGQLKRIFEFIAATSAYQAIFGKGAGGAGPLVLGQVIAGPSGVLMALQNQAIARSLINEGSGGTDSGPATDPKKLASLGQSIGEASMGSGVIGVGASPQIALAEQANTKLDSIDSKLGQLVNDGIARDPTKPLGRKYPLYSPGLQR
jgi:hypothetical protein